MSILKNILLLMLTCAIFNIANASKSDDSSSVIVKAMKSKTVILKNKNLRRSKDALNKNADYYAIYYSAHWCPPCRKFTPTLSKFYKENKEKYKNFEIIFVSSDKDEDAMEEYMKWGDMTYPALSFKKKSKAKDITKYSGKGIPCLVIVDRNGKVLSDSYKGTKYIGPNKVLKDLKKLIAEK